MQMWIHHLECLLYQDCHCDFTSGCYKCDEGRVELTTPGSEPNPCLNPEKGYKILTLVSKLGFLLSTGLCNRPTASLAAGWVRGSRYPGTVSADYTKSGDTTDSRKSDGGRDIYRLCTFLSFNTQTADVRPAVDPAMHSHVSCSPLTNYL